MDPDYAILPTIYGAGVQARAVGLALGHFEGAELRHASGLFNVMRNAGGAIGIALVNIWLQDATKLNALRLSEALGASSAAAAQ